MASKDSDSLQISWPGLIAVAVALLGMLATHISIESPRPAPPGAAGEPTGMDNLLPARMWQDPLATAQKGEQSDRDIRAIVDDARPHVTKEDCRVLFLFDCIDPDMSTTEAAEARRRERYATLSALSRAGYVPLEPDHIRYVRWRGKGEIKREGMNQRTQYAATRWEAQMRIPYEWFNADCSNGETYYQAVCVLWVNSLTDSSQQLKFLSELKEQLAGGCHGSHFAIKGRIDTGQLTAMLEEESAEDKCLRAKPLSGVTLYVTTSTEPNVRTKPPCRDTGLTIEYIIDSDDHLAQELLEELRRRRLHPDDDGASIVIIAERDTKYGQRMPSYFEDKVGNKKRIHHYSYLRGLDARVLSGSADPKEGPANKPPRQGEGDSQFDYLPRLAEQIKSLHEPVKAIGILGSDVYDKLVLLKALRPRFPEAIFFTTDLDVRLLQPEDYRDTRNLLIASHFGLSLQRKLQGEVAPFRCSYDTASYLGCLRAVGYLRASGQDRYVDVIERKRLGTDFNGDKLVPKGGEKMPVHLYEVGRSGAYELTLYDPEKDDPLGAENPRILPWIARKHRYAFLVWIAVCISVLLLLVSRPWIRFLCFALGPVFALRTPLARAPHFIAAAREALRTRQIRRKAARAAPPVPAPGQATSRGHAVVALETTWKGLKKAGQWAGIVLGAGWERLVQHWRQVFFLAAAIVAGFLLADIYHAHRRDGEEPFELFEGLSIWPTVVFRLLAMGLSVYYLLAACESLHKQKDTIRSKFFGSSPRSAPPGASAWLIWPFAWEPGETGKVSQLYAYLERLEKPGRRALRCVLMTGVSLGLWILVWHLFSPTVVHARGPIARAWNQYVLWATLIAVTVLVMFILDSTVQSFRFVTSLARLGRKREWPEGLLTEEARRYGLEQPDNPASEKDAISTAVDQSLCVRLIAAATEVVAHLIYCPFVVLLVLLVAHNRIFHDWHWNVPFAIIILIDAAAAILCAVELQRAAKAARREALNQVDDLLRARIGSHHDELREKLTRVRSDIADFKSGAFASFRQNPIIRAVLLPLFGAGGLATVELLLQYLH